MDLVAKVESSSGIEPGHMVIGQESDSVSTYFGFRFDPTELPRKFQPPMKWQEYLFSNKTFGSIYDERSYLERIARDGRILVEKRIPCNVAIQTVIPPQAEWNHFADYSFSPDDFHSDAAPCYNCVTWATGIAKLLVADFIKPVRQGRIKFILRQIRFADEAGGADE